MILTDHVVDKVRSLGMTLAEFLLDEGEVIEETSIEQGVKELISRWSSRGHSASSLS